MRLLFITLLILTQAYAQKADFSVSNIPQELLQDANAVYRVDEMTIHIKSKKDVVIRVREVITILNKNGEVHARNQIGYSNSQKINKAEVIIYNALGKEIRNFKRKDFKSRSMVDGSTLYSDSRFLYIDYTPVNYPYTMELTYETTTSNSIYLPTWFFISGYGKSSESSLYKIHYNPQELSINYKEDNFNNFPIEKSKTPGFLSYSSKNIKAIPFEHYSPADAIFPLVKAVPTAFHYEGMYGEASNWSELGKWFYDNIISGRGDLPAETIEEVKFLVTGIENPLEKAKIVYEFVQKNTRYISVQVGIGGLQPITAEDVDRLKYGDCKGLSNYTKALLEAVGVTSYYTHVEANKVPRDFDEDYASIEQGNHVILAIPNEGEYTWIDCTSQVHPFGYVGDFTDNRNVLVMKPDAGEIVRTVAYLNEENKLTTIANSKLDAEGNLTSSVKIQSTGVQYDNRFHLEKQPTDYIRKFYTNYLGRVKNLQLKDISFQNDKNSVEFTEDIKMEASNYASKSGNRLIVTINMLDNTIFVPDRYPSRIHPVKSTRGFLYETENLIHLPEGYEIEAIPTFNSINNKYGEYRSEIIVNPNHTISYKRKFFIREGMYPKEEYNDFRDFFSKSSLQDNAKIVLIKK